MRRNAILLILLVLIYRGSAQLPHTFTQYTSDDGLKQSMVQYIMQDHKGLMWFATWDGLFKFNGYTFQNYKAYPGNNVDLSNNRMESMCEDKYGYIWAESYDRQIYRFDPRKECFETIPWKTYLIEKYFVLPTGNVWIITEDGPLLRVVTDTVNWNIKVDNFFSSKRLKSPQKVLKVVSGIGMDQWILTNDGAFLLKNSGKMEHVGKGMTFYDFLVMSDKIFLASQEGQLVIIENGVKRVIQLPTRSSLKFLRKINESRIFVGTDNDGFFLVNTLGGYEHYTASAFPQMKNNSVRDVYVDGKGDVWLRVGYPGVIHFNPSSKRMDYFIMQDRYGQDITEGRAELYVFDDLNGITWVHPAGGGFGWYDRIHNRIVPFYNPIMQNGWNSDNRVASVFSDRQGNLWICSFRSGLEKVTFNTSRFLLRIIKPEDLEHAANNTRAIFQDRQGYIWLGCKDKVIRVYDKHLSFVGNLTVEGTISTIREDKLGMAYAFIQDESGTLWIGTKGNGLIAAVPVSQQKFMKYRLHYFKADIADPYSLSGNDVYSLYQDRQHRLWIATFDGGLCYVDLCKGLSNLKFISYKNRLKHYPYEQCFRARFVTADAQGKIWVGTTNGLIECVNPESVPELMQFNRFSRVANDVHSLSNNDVHSILFRNHNMYLATYGGGFNKLLCYDGKRPVFQSFMTSEGLPSDLILSIVEDKKQNLWLITEEELCKFNPQTEQFVNYSSYDFPQYINFSEGSGCVTHEGEILFNTREGIFHFFPDSILNSDFVPPIIFTRFQQTGDIARQDTVYIDYIDELKLLHNQNSFIIHFAALDMKYPDNVQYAYKLKGFEKEWNYVGTQRMATYTNLPKGNYVLEVKSTNGSGVWVNNVRSLDIVILPSFWETPVAYMLYMVGILLVIFVTSYILFIIYRLKHRVAMEKEITDLKLGFFTNVSHELRTPLTLIAGPIEQLLQSRSLPDEERQQLTLVERNTSRMLHLVNQILDFRKIQSKKMTLSVQKIDLLSFLHRLMENFDYIADEHQIDFKLDTSLREVFVWADADKLEKIVFNLLSNAFKYTPDGKAVKVIVSERDKEIVLVVADEGIGMSESQRKKVFNRFESWVSKNNLNQESTGIGLALVKELVQMHQGRIEIESTLGLGSRFIVYFKKGKEHYGSHVEFIMADDVPITMAESQKAALTVSDKRYESVDKEKNTLLIVEDNRELRFFLRNIFIDEFSVVEAANGKQGIEIAREVIPDVIISDIMMPEKDGIDMMKEVRDNILTSHIPIVLLTAKSTIESKLDGLKFGADDYITKPFSATYLKARIVNLLEQRRKLQIIYSSRLMSVQPVQEKESDLESVLSENDQCFMNTLLAFLEKHLDNGELIVEDMASAVNMSRSVFFRKLKMLTGLSPVEFLRKFRIKRAAELIKKGDYNISQIAFMTGFNDAHYFSKIFKQQFGMTPTEYKERG